MFLRVVLTRVSGWFALCTKITRDFISRLHFTTYAPWLKWRYGYQVRDHMAFCFDTLSQTYIDTFLDYGNPCKDPRNKRQKTHEGTQWSVFIKCLFYMTSWHFTSMASRSKSREILYSSWKRSRPSTQITSKACKFRAQVIFSVLDGTRPWLPIISDNKVPNARAWFAKLTVILKLSNFFCHTL